MTSAVLPDTSVLWRRGCRPRQTAAHRDTGRTAYPQALRFTLPSPTPVNNLEMGPKARVIHRLPESPARVSPARITWKWGPKTASLATPLRPDSASRGGRVSRRDTVLRPRRRPATSRSLARTGHTALPTMLRAVLDHTASCPQTRLFIRAATSGLTNLEMGPKKTPPDTSGPRQQTRRPGGFSLPGDGFAGPPAGMAGHVFRSIVRRVWSGDGC
jgi:hypothetical protein